MVSDIKPLPVNYGTAAYVVDGFIVNVKVKGGSLINIVNIGPRLLHEKPGQLTTFIRSVVTQLESNFTSQDPNFV